MSFLRYSSVIWICLLIIVGIQAFDWDGEAVLVYSVGSQIRRHILRTGWDDALQLGGLESRVVGIALSSDPELVYWSNIDVDDKKIMRRRSSRYDRHNEVIVDTGLVAPEQLAVDWITGNLYFIDNAKKYIGVCTGNGSYCTILLDNSIIDTPGDLVLNPKNSEMFWSDYGRNPQIWRSGMNGDSEARAVVSKNLGSPKGLAIDYSTERLYWIDSKLETIESISINGGTEDRQVLLKTKDKQLHSIAIFNEKIFCNDWKSKTIESMDLATGENREIRVTQSRLINDMEIRDYSIKPTLQNPCENHPCAELCLLGPGPNKYSCACRVGNVLNPDSRSCRPRNKLWHLVIAAGVKIIHYHDQLLGKDRMYETSLPILTNRLAYNRNTRSLITDDRFTNSLFSLNLVNDEIRRLTPVNSRFLGGIAFDDKNNVTTWSVTGLNRIDQMRLDDGTITRYDVSYAPRDIIRIPDADRDTWLLVLQDKICKYGECIVRMDQGVSDGYRLFLWGLPTGSKISLAYDESSRRLYFAHEKGGKIQSISWNNSSPYDYNIYEAKTLCSGIENPVSLAIVNRNIFWTVRDSNMLQWVDMEDKNCEIKSRFLPIENSAGIRDIVAVENIAN